MISFPVEFGLYSCTDQNCEDLQKMNQIFNKKRRLTEEVVDEGSASGNDEEFHLPPLPPLPPIKLPTIPPIEPPEHHDDIKIEPPEITPPGQLISKYKDMVHEEEEPFRNGAMAAMTFFSLSCIVLCGTLGIYVYHLVYEIDVNFERLIYGISFGAVLALLAPFLYFIFTFSSLNGGEYLGGMTMAVNSGIAGVVVSGAALVLEMKEKRGYIPLRGNDFVNIEMR